MCLLCASCNSTYICDVSALYTIHSTDVKRPKFYPLKNTFFAQWQSQVFSLTTVQDMHEKVELMCQVRWGVQDLLEDKVSLGSRSQGQGLLGSKSLVGSQIQRGQELDQARCSSFRCVTALWEMFRAGSIGARLSVSENYGYK